MGEHELLKILGLNIANARGRRNQIEIANASGIDISTISDLENGQRNPSYTTLLRIAAALGIELPDLLLGKMPMLDAFGSNAFTLQTRITAIERALLGNRRLPAAVEALKPKPVAKPKRKTVVKPKRKPSTRKPKR